MAIFTVTVTEQITRQGHIEIEASDWEEAEKIANSQYWNGDLNGELETKNEFITFDTEEETNHD